MKIRVLPIVILAAIIALLAPCAYADLPGLKHDFTYKQTDGGVDILRDGKPVTSYVYKDTSKPYFYPLYSPSGISVTRDYPMKNIAGQPQDHPHHRSFWIGYGDVNGVDFWTEGEKTGKIVPKSLDFQSLTLGYWALHTTNWWVAPDGRALLMDERYTSFLTCDYGTIVSTLISITNPSGKDSVTLGDSKEGFFALRLAPGMQLKGGTGHILNSEGIVDAACWGRRARWCDYTGEVNGKTVGIAIFDGPRNYGTPTYWQARDYGFFAANPFGGQTFTGDPKNNSARVLKPHESIVLVYAMLIHDGKLDKATLSNLCDQTVGTGEAKTPPQIEQKLKRIGPDRAPAGPVKP